VAYYTVACVIAVLMVLFVGWAIGYRERPPVHHATNVTQVPMTPYVLPNLTPAPPNT
jgi:hypothetical protein